MDKKQSREFLKDLCQANAIAANESQVRRVLKEYCGENCDSIRTDGLGSLIFTQEGEGPTVMVAAHMDEVGFMVRTISDSGLLTVMPVGNVRIFSRLMQEVVVTTEEGNEYFGILNGEYDASAKEVKNLYVDLGQDSKTQVLEMGVQIGDMITFASSFREYAGERLAAKALDDRAGCYVMGEAMKRMYQTPHPNRICYAATSSEEVGTRGGKTAAHAIKPDLCIVLDVACHSTEWVRNHTNNRQIGKGIMLEHYDKTMVANREMVRQVRQAAKAVGVELQEDMLLGGGTDGGVIHLQGDGCPTVVLGIPLRYGHSPYSIGCWKDMEDGVELVCQLLQQLDSSVLEKATGI